MNFILILHKFYIPLSNLNNNKNMKWDITLKQLTDLVADIDTATHNSTIKFSVDGRKYQAGLGELVVCEEFDDIANYEGYFNDVTDNLQYLAKADDIELDFVDVQDPNDMEYDNIKQMLIYHCNITDNSTITLHNITSEKEYIFPDLMADDILEREKKKLITKIKSKKSSKSLHN